MTSGRTRRAELLAATNRDDLVDLAERCLIAGPDVGMVVLTAREPVESTRFHLGEVLVTRTEVGHRGERGWSMFMGDDRPASLAAAILDAEVAARGPLAAAVEDLCQATELALVARRAEEWAELEPTVVSFEEVQ
jgi:alpha-D-ribose 1-methylphosphonate 5-triphosphate synthase subunit PhnG